MHKYSVIHSLWMAFFSKKFYRDVGQNWKGMGFLYLFMLLAIVWVPLMMDSYNQTNYMIEKVMPQIVEQMPAITIKNGLLSVDAPMPLIVKYDKNPNLNIMVVDTSGRYNTLTQAKTDLLVTQKVLYVKDRDSGEVYKVTYAEHDELRNLHLTAQMIIDYVDQHKGTLLVGIFIALYFVCLIGSFVYRILQALLYAVIANIFVKRKTGRQDFDFVLRITSIALTPAIILSTVAEIVGFNVPLLAYLAISIFYIYYGIHANKDDAQST